MASGRTLASAAAGLKPGRGRTNRDLPRLWLVSDPVRLPDPASTLARLPRGAGLIWRPYGLPWADALTQGRRLRRLSRRRGVVFLVAGDVRLAAAVGADGLHLPEGLARQGVAAPALLWRRAAAGRVLSAACHGPRALARAAALGADMAVLSPVFPTASHPGAATLGPLRFALMGRRCGRPVIALGGVTAATARRLPPGAAAGLAAVSGFSPARSSGRTG
ncbi:thiamine phosphate synthase [Roseospira navarrensis]|uniref:Thiamine phosphate synthase n=1 Tax=Roseospira navarrensis TaxID=140058 RepID=A0A7X1ZDD6_9PROT|nr:thiamine phosphate synthase [Roseospira navarrensis]MQX36494.1 thiamine phosphate synthase [Roseospira navarrensis]